jgi:hypothetical protein
MPDGSKILYHIDSCTTPVGKIIQMQSLLIDLQIRNVLKITRRLMEGKQKYQHPERE